MTTWNPSDKETHITLSNGNKTAASSWYNPCAIRADTSNTSGKRYFEVVPTVQPYFSVGVATSAADLEQQVGFDTYGWGFCQFTPPRTFSFHNDVDSDLGSGVSNSDVVMVACDLDAGKIWFGINGAWLGSGDPAAGTNAIFTGLSGTLFPMISVISGGTITGRFTGADFTYSLPSGFISWAAGGSAGSGVADNYGGGVSTISGIIGGLLTNQGGGSSDAFGIVTIFAGNEAAGASGVAGSVLHAAITVANVGAGVTTLGGQFRVSVANAGGGASAVAGVLTQYGKADNLVGGASFMSGLLHALLTADNVAAGASTASPIPMIICLNAGGGSSTLSGLSHALLTTNNAGGGANTISAIIAQFGKADNLSAGGSGLTGTLHGEIVVANNSAGEMFVSANRIEVWVVNTTTGGVSRYEAIGDVSIAWFDGKLLLAREDGLFCLAGADDDGEPIISSFTTGKMDFGTHLLKRINSINIGYTSDGTLEVETLSAKAGVVNANDYTWPNIVAQTDREGVVKIGKGLKSRYWQFVIRNHDGSAFMIDNVDIHPLILSRRR